MPHLRAACFASVLMAVAGTIGAGPGAEPAADTPAARFARIKAEYDADYKASLIEMKDPRTGQVVGYRQEKIVPVDKYVPRLLELGKSTDEATAVAALSLAVLGWGPRPETNEPFDLLLKRFAASPRLADFARDHQRHTYLGKEKRLERLASVAKDPTALALTLLDLGRYFDENFMRFQGEPADKAEARREKALALYRRVVAEFPEVEKGMVSAMAQRYITRLQQLRAGQPAPPITGCDLDGKPMKLEEFRGSVVVLDFWGSWCGPCRRKLPMMKEVAARYAGKGVVFLGVMSEDKAATARTAVVQEKVPWRNWLDLRDETDVGPIVKSWGVSGFPSVYVLDGGGKIRFTHVLEENELERALDALLAEKAPRPAEK
jgi:thiol-disulfide isomerase/thioredoxin